MLRRLIFAGMKEKYRIIKVIATEGKGFNNVNKRRTLWE